MAVSNAKKAHLALSDGSVFSGVGFGAERPIEDAAVGEVVFNTSMYGYQEIITDPSYYKQLMCFTYPHIGNVGCNEDDKESEQCFMSGIIVKKLSRYYSNFRAKTGLEKFCVRHNLPGLSEIDTRSLVLHLREKGSKVGALASGEKINTDDLVDIARSFGDLEGKDLVQDVTCKQPYSWNQTIWDLTSNSFPEIPHSKLVQRPHLVCVDCGIKRNILRLLSEVGFRVTVVPASYSVEQILAFNPDALFFSNGPGDPEPLHHLIAVIKVLLGRLPIFGICLGHQILAQACDAKTYKLKFGHHGGNHPVMDLKTNKVEITVQNHGFAVNPDTLTSDVQVSHINLNDHTVEGLYSENLKAFSVQYHPEACPGPQDSKYLFERFFRSVVGYEK